MIVECIIRSFPEERDLIGETTKEKIGLWIKVKLKRLRVCGISTFEMQESYIFIDDITKSDWALRTSVSKIISSVTVHEIIHLMNDDMTEDEVNNAENALCEVM